MRSMSILLRKRHKELMELCLLEKSLICDVKNKIGINIV